MSTHKCQCPIEARANAPLYMYEPEEYKAIEHEPNECPGDYEVKLYRRHGKNLWLCSCCFLSGDIEVTNVN